MIDIILSDRIHIFSSILVLVAIVTRKDLAVFSAAFAVSSSMIWHQNLSNAETYTYFCGINTLLVIIAGWYNSVESTSLAKCVAVLGCLAAILNLVQVFDQTPVSGYISTGLVVGLIVSLLTIDGRKGLLSGLYGDMRDSILRHVHLFSRNSNNKNYH